MGGEIDSNFSADCRYIDMPSVAGATLIQLRAFIRIKQQVTQFSQGTIAHVDQSETRNRRLAVRIAVCGSQGNYFPINPSWFSIRG